MDNYMATFGHKVSEETKEKIRKANKGQIPWTRGKKHSLETRKKMSEKQKGKVFSEEHRKNLSLSHSGDKSVLWRGGITPLYDKIRKCFKYRQWRSDIYTRDNFTCTECGNKKERLNADHIKPFSKIMKEYNITKYEQAENCEELWNINNGRTLCINCHKKTDSYGINSKKKL